MNPPTPEQLGKLALAIGKVMVAAGAVKKTGRSQQGYMYASDADLLYVLQPAMAANGLALLPYSQEVRESLATGSSKMKYRVMLVTTWRLIHSGGGWMQLESAGEGADPLDKAVYKAQTGAFKYALRQAFAIPTGDDPERDARNVAPEPEAADARPTWKSSERAAFCAELGRMGIKYEGLRDYCLAHDKPKPSSATDSYRRKLIKVLAGKEGETSEARVKLDTWLGKREDSEARP